MPRPPIFLDFFVFPGGKRKALIGQKDFARCFLGDVFEVSKDSILFFRVFCLNYVPLFGWFVEVSMWA